MSNLLAHPLRPISLSFAAALALWLAAAPRAAAANVGPAGYSTSFSAAPAVADWATFSLSGGAGGATNSADVDARVASLAAGSITSALASSGGNPPNADAWAIWSTAGYVQTRPTGNALTILMAALVNTTGSNVTSIHLAYSFTTNGLVSEQVLGQRVYYSRSGLPNSWTNIPGLSSQASGLLQVTLNVAWTNGSPLFLIFADDNAPGVPETACQIDNFSVATSGGTPNPLDLGKERFEDIFGRSLLPRGLTLVDWDGYMANPLIQFEIIPAVTNLAFPASVTLTANGARLYFDSPSSVGAGGPDKTMALPFAGTRLPVRLSIFPDRDGLDEDYTLTMVFTGADAVRQTNTVPVHVVDQDLQRTNEFHVHVNFDRDITGFFADPVLRALARQAADDWAYFFVGKDLDPVSVGSESTYIWSNNFSGGYTFNNTNSYTGYQLYAYGTSNAVHRSGGEGSFSGSVQRSNGVPLTIKRSGGFEAEIYGNYNTLGWLLLTNDNDWLVTGNLGHETNDFYSIAHHEIGHAMIFNMAHPGFASASSGGGFRSAMVTNYFGSSIPVNGGDHLDGSIDPESGQGAFGYDYYGSIPRKRWMITKLDLLCAREVGYTLRSASALAALTLATQALSGATATLPAVFNLQASGGIPFYHWELVSGSLPPGLALDAFTGRISGTPATNGMFTFAIRVLEYRDRGASATNVFTMGVAPAPPFSLGISVHDSTTNSLTAVSLFGSTGQRQIVLASSNLVHWLPIATNVTGTNLFQVWEANGPRHGRRFYKSVVGP